MTVLHSAARAATLVSLLTALAACSGDAQTSAAERPVNALPDQDLLDVPREEVIVAVPWSEGGVSHDPTPGQVRALLEAVEVSATPGFERMTFVFAGYSSIPAYRVAWLSPDSIVCSKTSRKGAPLPPVVLSVQFAPVLPADSAREATVLAPAGGEPDAAPTVALVCEENDRLAWMATPAQRTPVRVVEARNPPRLLVDVQRPPAAQPAGGTAPRDSLPAGR